jgi:acetoin utilization deacetylase AcuC-like enzyme
MVVFFLIFILNRVTLDNNFERAPFSTLARVHSNDYIRFIHELSKQVARSGEPVAFTPRVQLAVSDVSAEKIKSNELCDTSFSKGSLNAARRAVASVTKAVDMVVLGRNRNAFCCVRPPGHHAGMISLSLSLYVTFLSCHLFPFVWYIRNPRIDAG